MLPSFVDGRPLRQRSRAVFVADPVSRCGMLDLDGGGKLASIGEVRFVVAAEKYKLVTNLSRHLVCGCCSNNVENPGPACYLLEIMASKCRNQPQHAQHGRRSSPTRRCRHFAACPACTCLITSLITGCIAPKAVCAVGTATICRLRYDLC